MHAVLLPLETDSLAPFLSRPIIIIIIIIVFRLDALALSVIATVTWLAGWVAGCHTPELYQNR